MIEMISILLIPASICFTFGRNIKNKKQGIALFMVMFICLALTVVAVNEHMATPQLTFAQVVFPNKANGSIIEVDGKKYGS